MQKMQSKRPMYTGLVRFMVLKVTRLRRRGFTSKCAPLDPFVPFGDPISSARFDPLVPDDSCEPFDAPFKAPFDAPLPIFEKQARMAAGGKPVSPDWGYSPRSATSIAEGSRSLPTM